MSKFIENSLPPGDRDPNEETPLEPMKHLQAVALAIRSHQQAMTPAPSDEKFCQRFPALGSMKTYRLCRTGGEALARLKVTDWLSGYQAVLGQLQRRQVGSGAEAIYEDFDSALRVRLALDALKKETTKGALVIIEGGSGAGKTEGMKLAAAREGAEACWIEADESWESLNAALGDTLRALNVPAIPVSTAGRLQALTDILKQQHRILFIDEGEQLSRRFLNVIKTLINRTSAKFMVAANPTRRWNQLLATEEAAQLLHNRLCSRVKLRRIQAEETTLFLERRLGVSLKAKEWDGAVRKITEQAAHHGHGSYLRKLVCSLQTAMSENPSALDGPEVLLSHAESVSDTIKGRRTHEE